MERSRTAKVAAVVLGMGGCTALGIALSYVWGQGAADPAVAAQDGGPVRKPAAPETTWLRGTAEDKFAQIEKHLRGLDVTMAEVGYRYGELLFAGKARNWDYAQYQAEKIDHALKLALERRPKRAKSSQPFLTEDLPRVLKAIKLKDGGQLDTALDRLHDSCVQCHKAENVLYFKDAVARIKERASR